MRRWLASLLVVLLPGVGYAATFTATPETFASQVPLLSPGDTLQLQSGDYGLLSWQHIRLPSGSSWDAPVTLRAVPGATPVFRGLDLRDARYLVFDGLILDGEGTQYGGVFLGTGADHIRLMNGEVKHATGQGISGWETVDLQLSGMRVHHNGRDRSRYGHGLYIAIPHSRIEDSQFYANAGYGIQIYTGYGGTSAPLVIRGNQIYDNQGDGGVTLNHGNGIVFEGNRLWGNRGGGIQVSYGHPQGTVVRNNVVCDTDGWGIEISSESEGAVVEGNTLARNLAPQLVDRGHGTRLDGNTLTSGACPSGAVPAPRPVPPSPVPIPAPPPPVPQWTGVTVVFAWEYPVVQHHDTQFYLQIRQVGAMAREQLLPPLDAPTCARYPDPQRTAETLCGKACLAPGQYDFSLQAFRTATGRSRDSNSIAVHLTEETCLLPAAPLPPVPINLRVLKVDPSVPERLVLAWEFPAEPPLGPTFLLQTTTLITGTPTRGTRALDLLSPDRCAAYPDPARTGNTVCTALCLEPADYSLAVTAYLPTSHTHTLPTNTVDVDLSSMPSCKTPIDRSPLPPPKDLGKKDRTKEGIGAVVAGGLIVGGVVASEATASLPALINLGCVSWKVVGPCACGFPPQPCLQVEYSEPAWIVEVVKRPGSTTVPIFGSLLQAVLTPLGVPVLGGGGMGRSSGSGHSNLAYNEAHVYRMPNLFGGPCTACAPTPALPALHYASEIDPVWRTATATPLPVDVVPPIGTWARMYPRGGHVIHGSEPIAAAVAAVRAMDIVRQPVGTPPHAEAHVVTKPAVTDYACMQMASPRMLPCMPPGTPVPLWETAAGSPRGTFVYLFWQKRICCVHPGMSACGIATPGIGGHGMNLCLVPSIPPVP